MIRLEDSPLWHLTMARLREYLREPEMIFWTFMFPVVMALGLGIAFQSRGADRVPVAVPALAGSEALAGLLTASDRIDVVVVEPAEADRVLRTGQVSLVVEGTADSPVYRFDPTRPESRIARLEVDDVLQRAAGRVDPAPTRDVLVAEKGSRYIDFLIPGLIGLNLLGTGLWGVGFALVRMRSGKLLKRLLATPMRRGDFLASFILARLVFLAAELVVLIGFAWLVFDVTVRGSFAAVLAIAALGAFAFTGIGLLVASRARTLEGVAGMMNLAAVPMWILSGVFFSSERFPDLIQPLIRALPLTAVVDALRAVMSEGAPLLATSGSLAVILAWGVLSFATALAIFRWR